MHLRLWLEGLQDGCVSSERDCEIVWMFTRKEKGGNVMMTPDELRKRKAISQCIADLYGVTTHFTVDGSVHRSESVPHAEHRPDDHGVGEGCRPPPRGVIE